MPSAIGDTLHGTSDLMFELYSVPMGCGRDQCRPKRKDPYSRGDCRFDDFTHNDFFPSSVSVQQGRKFNRHKEVPTFSMATSH
jgi:hypothetical protein